MGRRTHGADCACTARAACALSRVSLPRGSRPSAATAGFGFGDDESGTPFAERASFGTTLALASERQRRASGRPPHKRGCARRAAAGCRVHVLAWGRGCKLLRRGERPCALPPRAAAVPPLTRSASLCWGPALCTDDTTFISQRRNFIHYVNEQRRGSGFDMANQRMSRSSSARSTLSALSAQSAGSEDSGAPPGYVLKMKMFCVETGCHTANICKCYVARQARW